MEKKGFATIENFDIPQSAFSLRLTVTPSSSEPAKISFQLDPEGSLPPGMVRARIPVEDPSYSLGIPGFEPFERSSYRITG